MNLFTTRKPRGFHHQMIYSADDRNDCRGSMRRDDTSGCRQPRKPRTLSTTALVVLLVLLVVLMLWLARF